MFRPFRGLKLDKDNVSILISIIAVTVSIASPFVTFRWLNQVDRDDRDKKQLTVWIEAKGGSGSIDWLKVRNNKAVPVVFSMDYALWLRKGGALPVGNVQVLLQFDPRLEHDLRVAVSSEIEIQPSAVEEGGRVRIRLKNQFAPTARDIPIRIQASFLQAVTTFRVSDLPIPELKSAWLYSDALSGTPIAVPPVFGKTNGSGGTRE